MKTLCVKFDVVTVARMDYWTCEAEADLNNVYNSVFITNKTQFLYYEWNKECNGILATLRQLKVRLWCTASVVHLKSVFVSCSWRETDCSTIRRYHRGHKQHEILRCLFEGMQGTEIHQQLFATMKCVGVGQYSWKRQNNYSWCRHVRTSNDISKGTKHGAW